MKSKINSSRFALLLAVSWLLQLCAVSQVAAQSGTDSVVFTIKPPVPNFDDSIIFKFKPTVQTWKVPKGVTQIHIDAFGAQGGGYTQGGKGGRVQSDLSVKSDSILTIYVGSQPDSSEAGFNGGGKGCGKGFGGGGASDIRIGGTAPEARVLVAGGGGGGIDYYGGAGTGLGGGFVGGEGTSMFGEEHIAKGGTQEAGGAAGRAYLSAPGELGKGGDALSNTGECTNGSMNGGGGGYYGGGSSAAGKAAGGSSFTNADNQNVFHEQGVREANGLIKIFWNRGKR